MKYLLLALFCCFCFAGAQCDPGGGGGDTHCQTTADVTIQFADICNGAPVVLSQFTITYPDGEDVDIRPSLGDPPGVYRIPSVQYCDEHLASVTADGYVSYIDTAVKFYTDYAVSTLTPIHGCVDDR